MIIGLKFLPLAFHLLYKIPILHKYILQLRNSIISFFFTFCISLTSPVVQITFFFLTSLLEYNCFTMLCQFLLYNKVNQLYVYIYPHISSLLCLPPTSLSHPSRWSQSTELISLCYAAASHYLSVLHLVVYICPCHSLTLSQLTLPPPCVKSILQQVCVFIPVLPLGSSWTFFFPLDSVYMC